MDFFDEALAAGGAVGTSHWLEISQLNINAFGVATHDWDPMHVDPVWAEDVGPFETTVSFGFLTMSLLTHFMHDVLTKQAPEVRDSFRYALNYGFDKVRLLEPVPVGSFLRAHFKVGSVTQRPDGGRRILIEAKVEIKGNENPALVCEWLFVNYSDGWK